MSRARALRQDVLPTTPLAMSTPTVSDAGGGGGWWLPVCAELALPAHPNDVIASLKPACVTDEAGTTMSLLTNPPRIFETRWALLRWPKFRRPRVLPPCLIGPLPTGCHLLWGRTITRRELDASPIGWLARRRTGVRQAIRDRRMPNSIDWAQAVLAVGSGAVPQPVVSPAGPTPSWLALLEFAATALVVGRDDPNGKSPSCGSDFTPDPAFPPPPPHIEKKKKNPPESALPEW